MKLRFIVLFLVFAAGAAAAAPSNCLLAVILAGHTAEATVDAVPVADLAENRWGTTEMNALGKPGLLVTLEHGGPLMSDAVVLDGVRYAVEVSWHVEAVQQDLKLYRLRWIPEEGRRRLPLVGFAVAETRDRGLAVPPLVTTRTEYALVTVADAALNADQAYALQTRILKYLKF